MPPRTPRYATLLLSSILIFAVGGGVGAQQDRGREEFGRAGCATCHGPSAKGAEAPSLIGLSRPYADFVKIVRDGTGEMSPMSKEDVSDEQLAVIYKWLAQPSSRRGERAMRTVRDEFVRRP
jgi:mono/diheme cytochrome c family protein